MDCIWTRKKTLWRLAAFALAALTLLCGCSQRAAFKVLENGNVVGEDGIEYTHLANEGLLYYLGDLEFVGGVAGEPKTSNHMGSDFQLGMFRLTNSETDNVLIRRPESEWYSIYRKASLEPFDFSVDNCVRLEFSAGTVFPREDAVHVNCEKGLRDPAEIAAFLADVRSQKSPREAGLYELTKNDSVVCSRYGIVYAFFAEEPNLAVALRIESYNDLAYSIEIEGKEYVLPNYWLEELRAEACGQTSEKGTEATIQP